MQDSQSLRVEMFRFGGARTVENIILSKAPGHKVYLSVNNRKAAVIEGASHGCVNPRHPKPFDTLDLSGLTVTGFAFRGKARYLPAKIAKDGRAGFYFVDPRGMRSNGDWDAVDAGPPPPPPPESVQHHVYEKTEWIC